MKTKDTLLFVLELVWQPVLKYLLILFTILFLNNVNVLTIILDTLFWTYLFKLRSEIPQAKDWLLRTPLLLSLSIGILWVAYQWLGALGILGTILFLILLAGLQIGLNWKLYDSVTLWGARVFKVNEKRSFADYYKQTQPESVVTFKSVDEVMSIGQGRVIKTTRTDSRQGAQGSSIEQPRVNVQSIPVLPKALVPQVPTSSSELGSSGNGNVGIKLVSGVQTKVRKRIKLKKVI